MQHLLVNRPIGLVEPFQHSPIDTDRGEEAVDRAWPLVETFRDRIEFLLAVERQVSAFRQVLAKETVGVLAGSPLPGAMGSQQETLTPVWAVSSAWRAIALPWS